VPFFGNVTLDGAQRDAAFGLNLNFAAGVPGLRIYERERHPRLRCVNFLRVDVKIAAIKPKIPGCHAKCPS
jgi:hypothetical protein